MNKDSSRAGDQLWVLGDKSKSITGRLPSHSTRNGNWIRVKIGIGERGRRMSR